MFADSNGILADVPRYVGVGTSVTMNYDTDMAADRTSALLSHVDRPHSTLSLSPLSAVFRKTLFIYS